MFKDAKVGDKVFDYIKQDWGTVRYIENSLYSLEVEFNNGDVKYFTMDGKLFNDDTLPILFWDEVKPIVPPKKPKPKLKNNAKVLVWNSSAYNINSEVHNRYFSHFNDKGTLCTYPNGTTSWSTDGHTEQWDNYKVVIKKKDKK